VLLKEILKIKCKYVEKMICRLYGKIIFKGTKLPLWLIQHHTLKTWKGWWRYRSMNS
jgi:hypothetical protein